MDSISENVVAMIAVVVGILVIGTALVPIVEHASRTETTETITGSNNGYDESRLIIFVTENHTISLADGVMTLDGHLFEGGITVQNYYPSDLEGIEIITANTGVLIDTNNNTNLSSGTATLTPDLATLTGIIYGEATSYSQTIDLDQAALVLELESVPTAIMSDNEVYGEMTDCTIGDGQTMYLGHYDGATTSAMPITTATGTVPYDGVTLTKNSNGTVTVSATGYNNIIVGPVEWSQTITTESGTSQYAALYGIIPIMCILAMAYVLIRRF